VRILVVVAGTQARALRAEAGKGSVRTAFGHGLVGPKQRDNSVERCTISCKPIFFFFLFFFLFFSFLRERERERERKKKWFVILPMFTHMEGSYRAAKGKRVKILAPGIGTRAGRKKLCEIAETQKN